MKKSSQVPASLIVLLAAGIASDGCGSDSYRNCVDGAGKVLLDSQCGSNSYYPGAHWTTVQTQGFGSGGGSGGSFGG